MDFNRKDCMGNTHHLFGDLDSGKIVILEFFMQSCSPCIAAGKKLEDMKSKLLAQYPGRIKAYAIGYSNTYSCASNANWVSSNGLTSIPMDSGAAQVAYYGGMGMPTIVILGGGKEHRVLGSPYVGFSTSDTTQMLADIRQSFKTLSVEPVKADITSIRVYPNPVSSELTLDINLKEDGMLTIEILDVTGKIINTVCNIDVTSGESSYTFNTSELAPGLYYIQISANGSMQQVKFNVLH
jgi:thiol-disulfide isomerase/thioredoxin